MCGRYTIDPEEQEIQAIIKAITEKRPAVEIRTGEIYPTNPAPILMETSGEITPDVAGWGFPHFKGSGVIINARAETALDKRMFRDSLLTRRCVIPSTGFFEWDKSKHKILFQTPGSSVLYMAGFYNEFQGARKYIILTTAANNSVQDIHNRMPVVLQHNELEDWITREDAMVSILHRTPMELSHTEA